MCGRYTLRASPTEIARGLGVAIDALPALTPRYNIAPTQRVLVFRSHADGQREAILMRWGFPSVASSPAGNLLVNARAETVGSRPSFRQSFARRRCLIPADGFYEWQKAGSRKQPYFIHRRDEKPFAFAGIWQDGPGGPTAECVMITQAAGEAMRPIHERQPVRLGEDAWDAWLSAEPVDAARLEALLTTPSIDDWVVRPISNFLNRVANDSPRCIEPIQPERQSELF